MGSAYPRYRLAQWLSTSLPRASALRLARCLSDFQWRRASVDRETIAKNLQVILGNPISESSPMVREVFRHFGRYLVEFFNSHQPVAHVRFEGQHHLTAAVGHATRGAILLSAHLGNWELGAAIIHRLGFSVSAVALPHNDPRMDRLFNDQRQRSGIEVIPLGDHAVARCLGALRQGRLVGVIGDREFGENGMLLSMFDRPVRLPRGPAILSHRANVPLIPTFLVREGDWAFRLCVEAPIWPETTEPPEDMIRQYAVILERYLRRTPEQWLLFRPLEAERSDL